MTSVKLINHSSSTADWNYYKKVTNGACRQVVKTSDCGSDMHGFESHLPPHFMSIPLWYALFV